MDTMTRNDLDRLDIPGLLKKTDGTCFEFAKVLVEKAGELRTSGDDLGGRVLGLLGDICSYSLGPGMDREPFGPRMVYGDKRSPAIEDLQEPDLAVLDHFVEAITTPDLKARAADVLFVRKRHHKYGRLAIDAYLEASQLLSNRNWTDAVHRLERALLVASKIRSERDRVLAHVTQEITKRQADGTYFGSPIVPVGVAA